MIFNMHTLMWVFLAWLSLACAAASNSTSSAGHDLYFNKRQSDPNTYASMFPSAILLQDGKQTFCPVVMISNEAGVMAASCVDREKGLDNGSVDFTVAVGLSGDKLEGSFPVDDIIYHDDYDEETFANNIAVITFKPYSGTHNYGIAMASGMYTQYAFVHRSLTANNDAWNTYYARAGGKSDDNACGQASTLFKENQDAFLCNRGSVPSMWNKNCILPYKYVIGESASTGAQLAIYSHSSAPQGDQFCGGKEVFNYYLVISKYAGWINSRVKTAITPAVMSKDKRQVNSASDTSFSMDSPDGNSENGYNVISIFQAGEVRDPDGNSGKRTASASADKGNDDDNNTNDDNDPDGKAAGNDNAGGGDSGNNNGNTVTVTETETVTGKGEGAEPITTTVTESVTVQITQMVTQLVTQAVTVSATLMTTATTTQVSTQDNTLTESTTDIATEIETETETNTEISSLLLTTTQVLTESVTTTSLLTSMDISVSECPTIEPCIQSNESVEVTITETETVTETASEVDVAVSSNLIIETVTEAAPPASISVAIITVTISGQGHTATETVTVESTVEPDTVTTTEVSTEYTSESVYSTYLLDPFSSSISSSSEDVDTSSSSEEISSSSSSSEYSSEAEVLEDDSTPDDNSSEESSSSNEGADKDNSSLNTKTIGIIITVVLIIILIMFLTGYWYYRRKRKQREEYNQQLAYAANFPYNYARSSSARSGNSNYYVQSSYRYPSVNKS